MQNQGVRLGPTQGTEYGESPFSSERGIPLTFFDTASGEPLEFHEWLDSHDYSGDFHDQLLDDFERFEITKDSASLQTFLFDLETAETSEDDGQNRRRATGSQLNFSDNEGNPITVEQWMALIPPEHRSDVVEIITSLQSAGSKEEFDAANLVLSDKLSEITIQAEARAQRRGGDLRAGFLGLSGGGRVPEDPDASERRMGDIRAGFFDLSGGGGLWSNRASSRPEAGTHTTAT